MAENVRANDEVGGEILSSGQRNRRRFLQQICAGAMAAAGAQVAMRQAYSAQGEGATPTTAPAALPTIKIGSYQLTRLIVGSNPVEGYSHSTLALSQHMREYFTLERTVEFASRCEQLGINTWQSGHGPSDKVLKALKILRERGSKIHWLCLAWEGRGLKSISEIMTHKPIAIVHHGGVTDSLFHTGKGEKVHDFVKKVHDAGVMAGVSTHNPANVAYIEEKGWENDFFMGCFYQLTRPEEEIRAKLGTVPLGEPFLESDREEMTAAIRKAKRPCLGFKILGAGRLCSSTSEVESAFQYAFAHIKSTDGIIVGMYPRFADEIAANVQLALKYGRPG